MTKILTPASPAPASSLPPAPRHPRVPLAPVLSGRSFARARGARAVGVTDAGAGYPVTSGRIAIGMALREMGLGQGDAMLVPAYHTLSMVAPLHWAGVRPVFYDVGPDGSVDLDELARRRETPVRAVMVTHYFGFHQDMAAIRAWCDRAGLLLLEDCAHAWFGACQGRPVGSWGDYAIASSMKFFPVYEGGLLMSASRRLDAAPPRGAGAGFEAKAALAALELAFRYRRLGLLERLLALPMLLKKALWGQAKRRGRVHPLTPDSSESSVRFDPAWLDRRSALFSRAVLRLVDGRCVVQRRRANYLALEAAVTGLPGCSLLHPALPEGVCPWVFPLRVQAPDALFARLVARGVPLTRFAQSRDPGAAGFPNSCALAEQVLGFPLHQELRAEELAWIVDALREAVHA